MSEQLTAADCVVEAAHADHGLEADHCITCADEGIALRVLELDDATALCADRDNVARSVAIDLVAPVAVGDVLLVHAGVAIRRLATPA
jgi:hydrogenase maturation factor